MLAQDNEHQSLQATLAELRRKQCDRPLYPPLCSQPSEPSCDRRWRQRHNTSELIRGTRVVALDRVEQCMVQGIKHRSTLPNFGIGCTIFAQKSARMSVTL